MSIDVRNRFNNAEEEFIKSFNDSPTSLSCFQQSWSTLASTLDSHSLDAETSHLVHTVAYRVGALASDLLTIHDAAKNFRTNLMSDLDSLFDQLNLDDHDTPSSPLSRDPRVPSPCYPSYIAPAYKWLLRNIHNPYPSKEIKTRISRTTGTSIQNVDAWFLNVRRRIGWTRLCKQYFSGSKLDTIAAAKRALLEDTCVVDGEEEPLSANIRMAFVQMEAAARELYSDKLTKSALAGKLEVLVKDMTSEHGQRKKGERVERRSKRKRGPVKAGEKYMSIQAVSLSPTQFTPGASKEDLAPLPSIAGRKRRLLDNPGEDGFETGWLLNRPMKRPRSVALSALYNTPANVRSATTRAPSVASSCSSISSSSPTEQFFPACPSRASSCETPLSEDESSTSPPSTFDSPSRLSLGGLLSSGSSAHPARNATHKRRLSEACVEQAHKRHKVVRPRLQTVSNPLPTTTSSNAFLSTPSSTTSSIAPSPLFEAISTPDSEWPSLFFDTPETAVLDELDLSMLREPEFSCVAECAALLDDGNTRFNDFRINGPDPIPPFNETDPLFGSGHPDLTIYSLGDATRLLSGQTPTSCPLDPLLNHAHQPLATLDDFSSLSSLPMNQSTTFTFAPTDMISSTPQEVSSLGTIGHIDWLSIIPESLLLDDLSSGNTFVDAVDVSQIQACAESARLAVGSTTPLTITPDARAEKYRQYRELLNKAKALEAELGQP